MPGTYPTQVRTRSAMLPSFAGGARSEASRLWEAVKFEPTPEQLDRHLWRDDLRPRFVVAERFSLDVGPHEIRRRTPVIMEPDREARQVLADDRRLAGLDRSARPPRRNRDNDAAVGARLADCRRGADIGDCRGPRVLSASVDAEVRPAARPSPTERVGRTRLAAARLGLDHLRAEKLPGFDGEFGAHRRPLLLPRIVAPVDA